ncbi:MAG TPA: UDP-N-acetylmuramoyl-L-alanyl-D-glutamate--2,6-diaminopimelate ligase [Vicinamibacterales bacterium]|jgi:UDP-N-acetylmuramoyl-L-alanyl-D-glutamate--2,6-diaminopimelate ligase
MARPADAGVGQWNNRGRQAVILGDLLRSLTGPEAAADLRSLSTADSSISVNGITYDSRRALPGSLFVALKGQRADGVLFAREAVDRGAVAIVSETAAPAGMPVPWVTVQNGRLALALLADAFYRNPSGELAVVGITGTNGKTTTAYLVSSLFEAAGVKAGLLSTVTYRIVDEDREASRTTPEASDLQAMLREMVERGCGACAMEVSSHALALHRVDGMRFSAAVFTNLTREHLDFHGDMAGYFAAKRRLFEMLPAGAPAAINLDDPYGKTLSEIVSRPVTYAINQPADVTPGPLSFSMEGLDFEARTPRGLLRVRSTLVGRPNVYNLLAAVTTCTALDLPFTAIEKGIASLQGVPGRFQVVSTKADDVVVIVDYAHTDDALRSLLETARSLAAGRLITVFGCGGERDRTKRPLMGAVAARLSDLVVITSDNPRSEDPTRIIDEIKRGLSPSGTEYLVYEDRGEAIQKAVELARPNDTILLAGKGHEKYQVIGNRAEPFDDVAVARDALARRRAKLRV